MTRERVIAGSVVGSLRCIAPFSLSLSKSRLHYIQEESASIRLTISRGEVVLRSDPKLNSTGSSDDCLTAIEKPSLVGKLS